ncbi:MAG: hypothetical protein CM1200mP26_06830 [Acidimicrobiales bacterium]|nr:MAG: hypothetical protein CM1200mP26_06830 [Acidimicrobiales bacterium]
MVEAIGVARSFGELTALVQRNRIGLPPAWCGSSPPRLSRGAAGYVGSEGPGEGIRALAKGAAKHGA